MEGNPLYGVALISSDSVNGQLLVYRYPYDFCGPEVTPLFQTHGDYSGWNRFAQLFNTLSKAKDIVVSYGSSLSMIPRTMVNKENNNTGETSGFVIVLLVNNVVVNESFSMQSFENCATYLSQCLLREEIRVGYLSQEKNILCNVLNEFKHSKQDISPEEQYVLNVQLEQSQLARELSQFYHEVNSFHHVSLEINNSIPFQFTLPTSHKPKSSVQYYTSELPISVSTIELYNALLLFYPPSYYLRCTKEGEDSFIYKFINLASPFLTFETMSVMLNVPIEKVFETALNLQEANLATIIVCVTPRTHFILAPDFPTKQINSKYNDFKVKFGELGSLLHILAIFSNAPRLESVFPQFNLPYTPYASAPPDVKLVYDAILYLLQKRLIVPIAIHCQYIESYVCPKIRKDQDDVDGRDEEWVPVHANTLFIGDNHYSRRIPSAQTLSSMSSGPLVVTLPGDGRNGSSFILGISKRLKNSTYYPFRMHALESFSDIPEIRSSVALSGDTNGERSHEQLMKASIGREESSNSMMPMSRSVGAESKRIHHASLLEKCKPLMKDHYCVEEICYKLAISHSTFWEMVTENIKHCFVYYVVNNLSCVFSNNCVTKHCLLRQLCRTQHDM